MCGRFTQTDAFDVLAERFGITVESGTNEELTARYNVAPTDQVPIVVVSNGARRLVRAKWGFRAAWMTDSKLAPINARAENIALNRMFQAALRARGASCRRRVSMSGRPYLARSGSSPTTSGSRVGSPLGSPGSGRRRTWPRRPVRSSPP